MQKTMLSKIVASMLTLALVMGVYGSMPLHANANEVKCNGEHFNYQDGYCVCGEYVGNEGNVGIDCNGEHFNYQDGYCVCGEYVGNEGNVDIDCNGEHFNYKEGYCVCGEYVGFNSSDWPFTDVVEKPGNWKYEAVNFVYESGIMKGVGDGTCFDPDAPLTREMFATILYRMEGQPAVTYTGKFPDVPGGKWYSNAIIWASEQGIVGGYSDGTFGTGDYITREQIAKMLMEYGKKQGYDVSESADFNSFEDAGKVSGWANDYMKWAVGSGMIGGSQKDGKNYLNPKGNATRAESATMLKRFMEKY